MKKKLILADQDEIYLTNLSNFFMEKAPQLELNLFTKKEKLYEYLSGGSDADILAVSEEMAGSDLIKISGRAVPVVLSASMNPIEGFGLVKKYQKTQSLLNELLLMYAEKSNSTDMIRGESSTRVTAFYSPGGGTGKTTLALSLASAIANEGKKVLYLNLEEIDSVSGCLKKTPGSLSDVFLALKSKGMNVGLKAAACVGVEAQGRFSYLSGTDSISEYEEIGAGELKKLVEALRGLSEFDLLVIDLSSAFSDKTVQILEEADLIFVPIVSEEGAVAKMQRFLHERELHDKFHSLFAKMRLVVNQAGVAGVDSRLQESGLLQAVPCCGAIASSPIFTRISDIIRSGMLLRQAVEPMIGEINGLWTENDGQQMSGQMLYGQMSSGFGTGGI